MGKLAGENNPDRYAKCSQPFEGLDTANDAMKKFFDEVSEARERHLIADVSVVVQDSTQDGLFMSTAHFGNTLERELLLAYALGEAREERRQVIADLLAGHRRTQKKG